MHMYISDCSVTQGLINKASDMTPPDIGNTFIALHDRRACDICRSRPAARRSRFLPGKRKLSMFLLMSVYCFLLFGLCLQYLLFL